MKVVFHVELHWHRWAELILLCRVKNLQTLLKTQTRHPLWSLHGASYLDVQADKLLAYQDGETSCLKVSAEDLHWSCVKSPQASNTKNKIPPSHDLWIEAWRLQSWNWCWLTGGIPQTPCWTPCSLQRGLPCRKRNTEVCGLCWRSSACAQQAGLDFSMNR